MFQLLPVLLRIATFMVDAGYGKAVIPILLKAKELYVSFTIKYLSFFDSFFLLTDCFQFSFSSSGFPGR
jgi:hypothetical protein